MSLTRRAVSKMLQTEKGDNKFFTVQCKNTVKTKGNLYMLTLSDGEISNKAIIQMKAKFQPFKDFKRDDVYKIIIHEYRTYELNNKKIIEILDCIIYKDIAVKHEAIVFQFPKEDDNRTDLAPAQRNKAAHFIKMEPQVKPSVQQKFGKGLLLLVDQFSDNQETKPNQNDDFNILGFEKIQDLYIGLPAWELLARVTDKNYREFVTKYGKDMKILTIECIDRVGWTIEGSFFGQQAEKHLKDVHVGKVYRMSRAKIEQAYNRPCKSDRQSKYSLKFYFDSSITEVRQVPQIPITNNNFLTLDKITQDILDEQHSFVGIVLRINPERIIPKQNSTLTMQTIIVGNPITKTYLDVVIWNKHLKIDEEWLQKTIMLKHFRLSKYKDEIKLNSTFRSDISKNKYYLEYEGQWNLNINKLADSKTKTLKQLDKQLENLKEGTVIISSINAWIFSISFGAKWFYDSCPNDKCKKGSTVGEPCSYCGLVFNEPSKRFTLPVEFCDFTGSIHVTAFDESADILLKGQNINEISSMSDEQRNKVAFKVSFDNYLIKIISKMDPTGKIRHNLISQPISVDLALQSQMNIKQISKINENKFLQLFDNSS